MPASPTSSSSAKTRETESSYFTSSKAASSTNKRQIAASYDKNRSVEDMQTAVQTL